MDKGFAPDVLADILTRLQPNTRRRVRLVCRHWRHLVDTRTATDLRSRAKTLVVTRDTAYVFDDLSTGRPSRQLWAWGTARCYKDLRVVGTCNGIICLCDDQRRGGAITLLRIPPRDGAVQDRARSTVLGPGTGTFTLGDASWRDDVKIMVGRAARCDLDAGIVSSDGKIYFTIEDTEARVISFDLDNENFTHVRPLPSILSRPGSWSLAEVQGRLAIAFSHVSQTLAKTEVWVMEGVSGQLKWNCWYILETHKMRHLPKHLQWQHRQRLARPHFAHGGEHVLTRNKYDCLFIHEPSDDTRKARHGVVEVSEKNQGTRVCDIGLSCSTGTFVYIETMEPMSVYKCW
ncbi:hypothetical protein QYE76_006902 [Lolium multiflorum]|uniref:F-box domain-containing protein n=1 Tax=Lolium multiflorum TaxID=4521 RepID=A0AAD8RX61_LOLMU|nr:hypothetical protein QYE76_006902 [Lolium multiflorum]